MKKTLSLLLCIGTIGTLAACTPEKMNAVGGPGYLSVGGMNVSCDYANNIISVNGVSFSGDKIQIKGIGVQCIKQGQKAKIGNLDAQSMKAALTQIEEK